MCIRSKLLVGMISICTIAALLTGCSSSAPSETKDIVQEEKTEGKTQTEDKKTEEGSSEENAAAEKSEGVDVSIEEQVLVDQDGIKITALEYVKDSIWGDGIKVLIENETDKDVMVGCNALIVNDYMINDLFASEVAAGKKSNETIYLSSSELKAAGIDTVGRIEIYFHVYDTDSYDKIFDSDCVTIETSAIDSIDTTANDEGTELYNDGGIRIIGKTVDENSFHSLFFHNSIRWKKMY